jgi:fructokinase
MNIGRKMRIGIDLGGTKIAAIALAESGETLAECRVETPAGNYDGTLMAIQSLVAKIEVETWRTGSVGIGIPGSISARTGLVRNANSVCLIGKPLGRDLSGLLDRQIRITNDANCFTLSEAVDGAAMDDRSVFGVILGTGVGGGFALDRRVQDGANGIAGEWGHNSLPWPAADEIPGAECYCGLRGCIETFLSGPAMARDHFEHTGQQLDAASIAARDLDGDKDAGDTLSRYEERLARALAAIINIIDPDCIVLGGGISNVARLYENAPRLWQRHVFSDHVETVLKPPRHGDASGVRGAAWLWPDSDDS